LYFFSPLFGLLLCLSLWVIFPYWGILSFFNFNSILLFCIISLIVYFLLGCGWTSFSKYSSIGSYRSAAQGISYEVRIILILLGFFWLINSFNLYNFFYWQQILPFFLLSFPISVIWLIICLAESNRSPFDFSEGESELVSGFNTEYRSGGFSLIFITEYGSILFLCLFTCVFLGGAGYFYFFRGFLLVFFYIWVRGSFPRLRYDKLILVAWKSILPFVLGFIIFIFALGIFF